MTDPILVAAEVADALAEGAAVVALESTIVTHGMPSPTNLEMARAVEQVIRNRGAVPATIAILEGTCHIGLTGEQIESLAQRNDAAKVTTRDLPWAIATCRTAGTTVAATMRLAELAGIRVFATGGIGGVHRGAGQSFDESADLTELSRTRVAVVSAGVKSILDIAATLERLETLGVPVLVNGSDEFPSFFSCGSGLPAPRRIDGAEEVAAVMHLAWEVLGLRCGISVANPVPEADQIPAAEIDDVVADALGELHGAGVTGRDVTPFLLARVVERTGGRSLRANVALVESNARFAAEIALADAAR